MASPPIHRGMGFLRQAVDPTTLLPKGPVFAGGTPQPNSPWKSEQIPMNMAPPPMRPVEPPTQAPLQDGSPAFPGQAILPPAPPDTNVMPPGTDGNPENIGEIKVTPPDQLQGYPWTSIEFPADQPPPPFMDHVITDPGVLSPIRSIQTMLPGGSPPPGSSGVLANPLPVPDVAWTSDIIRVGILPPPAQFAMR